MPRPLVIIESPHHGARDLHREYLEHCLRNSINRGEAPIATHKLYTDCLNDKDEAERKLGMSLLHDLILATEFSAIYYDLGISHGMRWGMYVAVKNGRALHPRSLYGHAIPTEYNEIVRTLTEDLGYGQTNPILRT